MYELKENAVIIFKNDKKDGESHPDYKGQINVKGETLDIALWVKEGKKGKFFSGKVSEPWKKPEPAQPPASDFQSPPPKFDQQAGIDTDNGDDLPF
jgi:hypothetical protein